MTVPSIKPTLLNAVSVLETREKRPIPLHEIYDFFGARSTKISATLWQLAKSKELKKVKVGSSNAYSLSAAGKKILAKSSLSIMSHEEVREWAKEGYKGSGATTSSSTARYSSKAVSAIDGIAQLVDSNERLINTIRSIHSQLGSILKEHDDERQEPDSE
jgi:hypothetical protein